LLGEYSPSKLGAEVTLFHRFLIPSLALRVGIGLDGRIDMDRLTPTEEPALLNRSAPDSCAGAQRDTGEQSAACAEADSRSATPAPEGTGELPEGPVPTFTLIRIVAVRMFLTGWMRCFGLWGLYKLGQFFAIFEFACDYRRRGRVERKLISYFKDEFSRRQRIAISLRYFIRVRCDKMFYTIMDRVPRDRILARVREFNIERLHDAMARKKGVYAALCHFGSHYVAGLIMALKGYEMAGFRDPKQSAVRNYIQRKYRETFPEIARMKVFPASNFPRAIYRHLQSNYIVASLIDAERKRGETTKTHPVTIFGEQRNYLIGPLQIAIRCGSPILQGFVVSRRNFYYDLIVAQPLHLPEEKGDEDQLVSDVIQRYATAVEQFARNHPDHLMNI
jgi:lauroyl/myristoyl acyltransferase